MVTKAMIELDAVTLTVVQQALATLALTAQATSAAIGAQVQAQIAAADAAASKQEPVA